MIRCALALQVPLLRYLEDRVPGLAAVAKDAGGGDDSEPLQQTVLDALTDAAEALQVLDVQRRYPDALGETQPVRTHWDPSRKHWPGLGMCCEVGNNLILACGGA